MKLGIDTAMRTLSLCLALGLMLVSCLKVESNAPPVAKIVVRQGSDTIASGDTIAFRGSPIKITLDGESSSDTDGQVVKYAWTRTDVPASARAADSGIAPDDDGGVKSTVPPFTGDPAPKSKTEVTLKVPGKYRYSLWVTDNEGATSVPASVMLNVAAP